MSWVDPRAKEQRTRAILRAGVLWGMLGLMTLLAWLMQVGWVPVGGAGRLPQKVTSGDLTLWLPDDFAVLTAPGGGEIFAQQQGQRDAPAVLRAFVEPQGALTPARLMRDRGRGDIPAEAIPMGDGQGRLRVSVREATGSFWGLELGWAARYLFVVSAVREVDGRIVTIELQRPLSDPRGWDPADVSLVRRIAAHMELS